MSTTRNRRFIAAGLVVMVGLLLALAAQVGLSAAATGTSGARSSSAMQGAVRIHLHGTWLGADKGVQGRFTISGAISDRGTFVGRSGHVSHYTLVGAKGTIRIKVGSLYPGAACQCNWQVTKGTRKYAGLRGRGRVAAGQNAANVGGSVDYRLEGTVSK